MYEYYPLIVVGITLILASALFAVAYLLFKRTKVPGDETERKMSDREVIVRLLKYAKPYRLHFLLVLFVMLLSASYNVLSPILVGQIEELVKESFELSELYRMVLLYSVLLLVSLVCLYVQAIVLQKTGQKIISKIRMDVFSHIESLSHGQLSSMPVGKLVTRVSNDPNHISYMFTNILVNLLKNCLVISGVLVAMFLLNLELSLMVLCFIPFMVIITVIFSKYSRRVHRRVNNATTDINTFLSENLSGIKITQIFNKEAQKMSDFRERSQTLKRFKFQRTFVFGVFRPVVYMLYIASILCLFYLGAKGYIQDRHFMGQVITSGTVVTFYIFISRFYNPIQELAEQFDMLQRSFASAEKIFTVLDIEPEIRDDPDAVELETVRGEIEFRDVWFAYKPGEWVLKGVSFHIYPNQTVAFVGSTGSGKTTILSLICRNYEIQKGQILIDGRDIRTIRISSLRSHFGQMLQDVFLFSGDIRSNILLSKEGVSDEEIMETCRYVNADSFISKLPKGLDEPVRERGNNFSAGQRQLISFARTIIHHPSVIILDEATANIDTETEVLIQDSLEKIRSIGTTLMVAHRLSTIQHSDNIIVLSKGQIVEQGSHQQLLAAKGKYYHLYTIQNV